MPALKKVISLKQRIEVNRERTEKSPKVLRHEQSIVLSAVLSLLFWFLKTSEVFCWALETLVMVAHL